MRINREEIIGDVADLAYVVGDVNSDGATPHRLHQTFDICAEGNIERVNRMIDLATAEVNVMLRHYRDDVGVRDRLVERYVHEYLVARVMYDWLSVTIPEVSDVWREKASEARSALASATTCAPLIRRLPPI